MQVILNHRNQVFEWKKSKKMKKKKKKEEKNWILLIIINVCPSPPTNIIEQSFFFPLFSLSQLVRLLLKLIVLTSFQDSPAYSEALEIRPSSHWIMGLAKNPMYAYFTSHLNWFKRLVKLKHSNMWNYVRKTYQTSKTNLHDIINKS